MLILNDGDIRSLQTDWTELADLIERTVRIADAGDYSQPIKPYLRYGDPRNRIIAMPAYVGGEIASAGLKWIASFPGNLERGLPRAHGLVVLNRADTGQPEAVLSGGRPNALRTAAVSGCMLRLFANARTPAPLRIGIIGWGPVGRAHFEMCAALFGDRIERFTLFDLRGIAESTVPETWRGRTVLAPGWEEAYLGSNVCITCTVAERRYIDVPPPEGSLLLDVSLRDYAIEAIRDVKAVVVDDWDEVCRENTDIELLHKERGLTAQGTVTLADAVCRDALRAFPAEEPVLFCPMGMAVFDIALAELLVRKARLQGVGTEAGEL